MRTRARAAQVRIVLFKIIMGSTRGKEEVH